MTYSFQDGLPQSQIAKSNRDDLHRLSAWENKWDKERNNKRIWKLCEIYKQLINELKIAVRKRFGFDATRCPVLFVRMLKYQLISTNEKTVLFLCFRMGAFLAFPEIPAFSVA